MKSLIAALLIISANAAGAAGFSPWTGQGTAEPNVAVERAETPNPGFGPWREHAVRDETRAGSHAAVAAQNRQSGIFRPWS